MKAIRVKEAGTAQQLQLQECEIPSCGSDDVLIELKVAGINFIDIYVRTGLYPTSTYPYTPGKEGSGIVVAVGEMVSDFKKGDRVTFCSAGSGSYAEFIVVPANQVVLIPEALSFEIAAAAMLQGLT